MYVYLYRGMSVSYSAASHASFNEEDKYDLSSKCISSLSDVKIPQVLVLILSNNQFKDFSTLPPNNELQVLQADNNKLEVINPEDFSVCPSLSTLNLSFNLISKIPFLKPLQSLKTLDLTGNNITVLENLEENEQLNHLLLAQNRIHSVILRSPMKNLLKLDLRFNPIDQIQFGNVFTSIVSLHLDHCNLTSFSGLSKMHSLTRLSLSFNKITDSQPLILPNLEFLNVSNNALTTLRSFYKLSKIVSLNVSFNPIDDHGFSISSRLSSLRTLLAVGTKIVHPNLILRFAPNVEKIDLSYTRISQLPDAKTLVHKAIRLQSLDLRGTPLTYEYYPDIKGKAVQNMKEYECIEDYDQFYQNSAVLRNQYRQSLLSVSYSSLEILDGIHIRNEEAKITSSNKKILEDESEQPDLSFSLNQSFNAMNDNDYSNEEKNNNSKLKSEKRRIKKEKLINSIDKLLKEQNQLREKLNLEPKIDFDDLQQYNIGQLEEYKHLIIDINSSLAEKVNSSTNDTSEELNRERKRNRSLKKELKDMQNNQHYEIPEHEKSSNPSSVPQQVQIVHSSETDLPQQIEIPQSSEISNELPQQIQITETSSVPQQIEVFEVPENERSEIEWDQVSDIPQINNIESNIPPHRSIIQNDDMIEDYYEGAPSNTEELGKIDNIQMINGQQEMINSQQKMINSQQEMINSQQQMIDTQQKIMNSPQRYSIIQDQEPIQKVDVSSQMNNIPQTNIPKVDVSSQMTNSPQKSFQEIIKKLNLENQQLKEELARERSRRILKPQNYNHENDDYDEEMEKDLQKKRIQQQEFEKQQKDLEERRKQKLLEEQQRQKEQQMQKKYEKQQRERERLLAEQQRQQEYARQQQQKQFEEEQRLKEYERQQREKQKQYEEERKKKEYDNQQKRKQIQLQEPQRKKQQRKMETTEKSDEYILEKQPEIRQRQNPRKENEGNRERKERNPMPKSKRDFNKILPADPDKVHLAGQLMAENALLRSNLGKDPLDYYPAESFNANDIDMIIAQLLDDNKVLEQQINTQNKLLNDEKQNKRGSKFNSANKSKRNLPNKVERYDQYLDLQGSREGCSFWVPLDARKQQEQQEYYRDMQLRLPIAVSKNERKRGCNKCENTILMMARVPLYPPDAHEIKRESDEYQLVESYVVTSLNRRVELHELKKSHFSFAFIENERTMHNIHLVVIVTNDHELYLKEGIKEPILVSEHFKYVNEELTAKGQTNILICGFDKGNQANNFCEHTILPNLKDMKSMNESYDSLFFRYRGHDAIMALDPNRLVPLYSIHLSLPET